MDIKEFNSAYNPDARCFVVYKEKGTGYNAKGLLLDGIQESVSGTLFVFVDSFCKRVPLSDVIRVQDTGTPWMFHP